METDPYKHFDGTNHWQWNGTEWVIVQPAGESPEAAKRRKMLPFIIIPLVLLALLAFFAWPNLSSKPQGNSVHTVRYQVEGFSYGADITYMTPTGISQQSGLKVPLTSKSTGNHGIEFTFIGSQFVSISAQSNGEGADMRCEIYVDNVLVSSNVAKGSYAVASCDAMT